MWLWIGFGLGLALALVLLLGLSIRGRLADQVITTPYFTLIYPGWWYRPVVAIAALLELCHRVAREELKGKTPDSVTLIANTSWEIGFRARRFPPFIQLGFLIHPWIDGVFLNLNFGICHEFGHLVEPDGAQRLQEAWAHFFALYALRSISKSDLITAWRRLEFKRDYVAARAAFSLLRCTWGAGGQVADTALLLLRIVDQFGVDGLENLLGNQSLKDEG